MHPHKHTIACIALAAVLMAPTTASGSYQPVVEPWLGAVAEAAQQQLGDAPENNDRILDALEDGAYRSALTLIGEALAQRQAEDAWENAQNEPDPAEAFFNAVAQRIRSQDTALGQAVQAFGNQSLAVSVDQAEPFMVAAHFFVWAEQSNHEAASMLAGVAGRPDLMAHPIQRYTIMRPIVLAGFHMEAATSILIAVPGPRGSAIDLDRIQATIDQNGGSGDHWRIHEAGVMHALARHVTGFQNVLASPEENVTLHDARAAVGRVPASFDAARGAGLMGLRLAATYQDAAWWLDRAEAEYSPAWEPLVRSLFASVEGARYETDVLQEAVIEDEAPWPWMWIGGSAGGLALLGGATFVVRRRRA